MNNATKQYVRIVEKLKTHSSMKQYIHRNTMERMMHVKQCLRDLNDRLLNDVTSFDKSVEIKYLEKNEFECEFKFSDDVLIFSMHSDVFTFSDDHPIFATDYVKENPERAYCGMIEIYNFLSDSIKYNRTKDIGYLIGRVFINNENHFFIEGKKQVGFDFNNFGEQVFEDSLVCEVINNAVLYCIDFELYTPPLENSGEITLADKKSHPKGSMMDTGKRLGFEFNVKNIN